jgi:hypothetical protein
MSAHLTENLSISTLAVELNRRKYEGANLALAMYNMNCAALRYRYPDDYAAMIAPFELIDNTGFSETPSQIAQFYQSLCHYLYQCSEGEVPKTPLYEKLQKRCDDLAHEIADRYASEHRAKWE